MNGGKFPTASFAVKQVGGSYYTVRKIIQELQYRSKLSSSDTRKGTPTISFLSSQLKPAMPVSIQIICTSTSSKSHTSYASYQGDIPDAIL